MIYEKLDTRIDIPRLRKFLEHEVLRLRPANEGETYGGWSVLSSDGHYLDGWHRGSSLFSESDSPADVAEKMRNAQMKPGTKFIRPTEICHGYLGEIVYQIAEMGLHPHRMQIARLKAGTSSSWHRDGFVGTYAVRLHVPIITNPECFFEIEGERAHLPADGSAYLIDVSRLHRVVNESTEDRIHLVAYIVDTQGVSKFHQYQAPEA